MSINIDDKFHEIYLLINIDEEKFKKLKYRDFEINQLKLQNIEFGMK